MTNLKRVNEGFNKFCGPAVLSILTGRNTDECARVITKINGSYNVTGVQLEHLLKAADIMGFDSNSAPSIGTLFGTISLLSRDDGMYIITLPNHFVVIEINDKKAYFCDNHTKEPIPAASSARLTQKVMAVNKIVKRPEAEKPPEPKLTMTDFSVLITRDGLFVDRVMLYDNPEHDKREQIGSIRGKDEDEMSKILQRIREELSR